MRKLKVGFLVDGLEVPTYVADLIWHVANEDVFYAPLIIHGHVSKKESGKLNRVAATLKKLGFIKTVRHIIFLLLYKGIAKIELKATRKLYKNYGQKVNIAEFASRNEIIVQGIWSKSGFCLRFSQGDLKSIDAAGLDCIIRCGTGILRGEILNITRFGVLSFHHGDNRENRGGPSGFWEVLNNEPSSGFIIQKLKEELDGGAVLFRGNIMTSGTWSCNSAALLEKSNFFLKKLLEEIAERRCLPLAEGPRLHDRELFKLSGPGPLFSYIGKILIPKIVNKFTNHIFSHHVIRWSIAYAEHNNFSKSLWRYTEIENPKGRFLADPFVVEHHGRKVIFVEDLFYSDNKGRISAIELKESGAEFIGNVLEEDFHLAFPFVFEIEDNIYMIPETHQTKDIRLYRCTDFPKKWVLEKILLNNVSAVDTMVVKRDNLWFMLTNICSAKLGDHQSELHVFYSSKINGDKWLPIESGNPVIFDSRLARNGGMFYFDGELYRVNQIHGKAHYGKAFGINKVLTLSKSEYREERITDVDATFKDNLISTHHFNANESVAVIDFGRRQRLRQAVKESQLGSAQL